jgi:hypothetical protein
MHLLKLWLVIKVAKKNFPGKKLIFHFCKDVSSS